MADDILTTGDILKGREENSSKSDTPKGFKNINWDTKKGKKKSLTVPGLKNPMAEEVQVLKKENEQIKEENAKIKEELAVLREEKIELKRQVEVAKYTGGKEKEGLQRQLEYNKTTSNREKSKINAELLDVKKELKEQAQKTKAMEEERADFEEKIKKLEETLRQQKQLTQNEIEEKKKEKQKAQSEFQQLNVKLSDKQKELNTALKDLSEKENDYDTLGMTSRAQLEKANKMRYIWTIIGILLGVCGGVFLENAVHICEMFM